MYLLYYAFALICFGAIFLNQATPARRACGISGFFYLAGIAFAPLLEGNFYGYFYGYAWLDFLLASMLHFAGSHKALQIIVSLSAFYSVGTVLEVDYLPTSYLYDYFEPFGMALNLVYITTILVTSEVFAAFRNR